MGKIKRIFIIIVLVFIALSIVDSITKKSTSIPDDDLIHLIGMPIAQAEEQYGEPFARDTGDEYAVAYESFIIYSPTVGGVVDSVMLLDKGESLLGVSIGDKSEKVSAVMKESEAVLESEKTMEDESVSTYRAIHGGVEFNFVWVLDSNNKLIAALVEANE